MFVFCDTLVSFNVDRDQYFVFVIVFCDDFVFYNAELNILCLCFVMLLCFIMQSSILGE